MKMPRLLNSLATRTYQKAGYSRAKAATAVSVDSSTQFAQIQLLAVGIYQDIEDASRNGRLITVKRYRGKIHHLASAGNVAEFGSSGKQAYLVFDDVLGNSTHEVTPSCNARWLIKIGTSIKSGNPTLEQIESELLQHLRRLWKQFPTEFIFYC